MGTQRIKNLTGTEYSDDLKIAVDSEAGTKSLTLGDLNQNIGSIYNSTDFLDYGNATEVSLDDDDPTLSAIRVPYDFCLRVRSNTIKWSTDLLYGTDADIDSLDEINPIWSKNEPWLGKYPTDKGKWDEGDSWAATMHMLEFSFPKDTVIATTTNKKIYICPYLNSNYGDGVVTIKSQLVPALEQLKENGISFTLKGKTDS